MSAHDDIRGRLRFCKDQRRQTAKASEVAAINLVRTLREAIDAGISHSEACRLAGITRAGGYHVLAEADRKDKQS